MSEDMEFFVQVLRINDGNGTLPKDLRTFLQENARYVRRYSVWLFEGDWETCFSDWEQSHKIEHLGEIITPSLHRKKEPQLESMVKHLVNPQNALKSHTS